MKIKISLLVFTLSISTFVMAQWENSPITGLQNGYSVMQLYDDGNILWAGATGQIFKSTDKAATWTLCANGLQSGISGVSGIAKLGDRIYASFSGNGNYFTYYSTDNGAQWNLDTAGWNSVAGIMPAAVQLHTHKDYILARLESNYIMYKKNTDSKWSILPVPSSHRTPGNMYSVGDTLVLGCGYIAMSVDMGANWTLRQSVYPAGTPLGFLTKTHQNRSNPKQHFANYVKLATNKPVLFVSNDNQITWDSIHMDLNEPHLVLSMWVDGNDVYAFYEGSFAAADTGKNCFHSSDGGITWNNITGNLYQYSQFKFHGIVTCAMVNGYLYGGGFGNGGLVRIAAGTSTGLDEPTKQNGISFYPNPASAKIYLNAPAHQVSIYNIHGQQVLSTNSADGLKEIDIASLNNGLYLISLTDGDKTSFSRLIKQ